MSVEDRCETGNGLRGLDEGVLCDMWGKAVLQVCREWGCRKVFYLGSACLSQRRGVVYMEWRDGAGHGMG